MSGTYAAKELIPLWQTPNRQNSLRWFDAVFLAESKVVKVMQSRDLLEVIERNPEKVSGAWVFRGTRVPVIALFENLKDGASIDQFLEWFPGVTRAQVEALLEYELSTWTQTA